MEIWDIYDNNRVKTGKTHIRGEKMADGDNIVVVMVLIFDSDGRMLIQQRPAHMAWGPGKWTMTAGGALKAGETSTRAAARELYEELGITIDFENRRPNFAMTNQSAFIDYFIVHDDIDVTALAVPNDEVAAAKWASKDEMLDMVDRGECVPYRKPFVEYCFDVATRPILDSTHSK
ncbi:MAG: NUDIX domain-containing protein [Clostridiales bacterium]|jgi:8-oxo-dGTP pyrophosphatase MutT (NUDIX family)|nr:NUDIX domain-containing protein [Clostridiales bacterium]